MIKKAKKAKTKQKRKFNSVINSGKRSGHVIVEQIKVNIVSNTTRTNRYLFIKAFHSTFNGHQLGAMAGSRDRKKTVKQSNTQ